MTKLETKTCLPCVRAKTRKKTVHVFFTSIPKVSTYGTCWDGGSRYNFAPMSFSTGMGAVSVDAPGMPRSPFSGPASVDVPCVPFWAVAQTGTFCGKDAGLTLHVCDYGDSTLRALLLGAIQGQTPWGIVADRYRDLGVIDNEPAGATAEVA